MQGEKTMPVAALPSSPARRRAARRLALALLACSLVAGIDAPPAAAQDGQPVERRYRLKFVVASEALSIAQNLCPADGRCDVTPIGREELRVIATATTQAAIAKALQAGDLPPAAQAFQLVLLEAHRGGSGIPDDLPSSARKALADVADFLPYGRFDLIAPVGFIRTTRDARVTVASDEEVSYELDMAFRGDPRQAGSELLVDVFRLRLVPAEPMLVALAMQPGYSAGAALPRRPPSGGGAPAASAAPPARSGAPGAAPAASPAPPAAVTPLPGVAENLLSTSFAIRKGETVVVGTSKLSGNDRALVVLLTALP
jgi:hypothetical protein